MNWIESIKNYNPYNEQEVKDKELVLNAINAFNNLLTRENTFMHVTSSGYIVNKTRTKVLMIYHKIYNSWSWTGGHADGDDNLLSVAIKEAKEETGLKNISVVSPNLFSLEVIPVNGHIKRGEYISSHLHLNLTYLLEADENEELVINEEETKGVKWIPISDLSIHCSEPYMVNTIYEKLNSKIINSL